MLSVKNVKVYDLEECVIACRNAMRTEMPAYTQDEFFASLPRAIKLCQASKNDEHIKCHDNFLTGIRVSFDIVYPQYISPELQRYHWIDIVTSSSKMHKLLHRKAEEACNEYTSQSQIDTLQFDIDRYNRILGCTNFKEEVFVLRSGRRIVDTDKKMALYHARIIAMSDCPMGYELFMRVSTNYKQLQTIYWQRRDHRLMEDWGAFCDFVKSLPYSNEFIFGEPAL